MSKDKIYGPNSYKRDNNGLLECVPYEFNKDGSVNWRAMIKPEFLYPNKGWFEARKKETPKSIKGLKDNQLLIMLGGIKDLARVRGFHNCTFETENISDGYVVSKCNIDWIGNYESSLDKQSYQDVANATLQNTSAFCAKFLETIACNRAFVRCVRNFLNIHIVGADEIDNSNKAETGDSVEYDGFDSQNIALTPQKTLQKAFNEKSGSDSIEEFKGLLREFWSNETYRNQDAKSWSDFSDIPAKECRRLITLVKSKKPDLL